MKIARASRDSAHELDAGVPLYDELPGAEADSKKSRRLLNRSFRSQFGPLSVCFAAKDEGEEEYWKSSRRILTPMGTNDSDTCEFVV